MENISSWILHCHELETVFLNNKCMHLALRWIILSFWKSDTMTHEAGLLVPCLSQQDSLHCILNSSLYYDPLPVLCTSGELCGHNLYALNPPTDPVYPDATLRCLNYMIFTIVVNVCVQVWKPCCTWRAWSSRAGTVNLLQQRGIRRENQFPDWKTWSERYHYLLPLLRLVL